MGAPVVGEKQHSSLSLSVAGEAGTDREAPLSQYVLGII